MSTTHPIFNLQEQGAYQRWRARKLAEGRPTLADLVVQLRDPARPTAAELDALQARCGRFNSAIYDCGDAPVDRKVLVALCARLGLRRLDGHLCADDDGVSSLRVMPAGSRHEGYIPYTNRPLSWHTDGYYNDESQRIRAMLLHCRRPAAKGGENFLLDHERVYIRLRDEQPEWIAALMHPQAMTIPANVEQGEEIRPARTGPVFSVDRATGALHMRYTARKRNIEWRDDPLTREAVAALERLCADDNPDVVRVRLQAGQGIVSNNALHRRTGFEDAPGAPGRWLYRARFHDRVNAWPAGFHAQSEDKKCCG